MVRMLITIDNIEMFFHDSPQKVGSKQRVASGPASEQVCRA